MGPRLPFEILLEIFHQVQQQESPVSWSLVCKAFCDVARQILFREVTIGVSTTNIEDLDEILRKSLQILPYVEVLRIAHQCKLPNETLPAYPYPEISPLLDLFYHHADKMTELHIIPGDFPSSWSYPPSSWQDLRAQTQSALLHLFSTPRIQAIHIEGFIDIPVGEHLDLPRLTRLAFHNARFRDNPGANAKVMDLNHPQSNLRVLQISGGDTAGILRMVAALIPNTSRLERLSIVSTTPWSAQDMSSLQRLISLSCASLAQIDLRIDDYDYQAIPETLDLSHLTCLRTVTTHIQYFSDGSAYSHLPSPTPVLVARLSTLPADLDTEIRLTLAVQFLSVLSSFTTSDLDSLDIALAGKNARVHIWVAGSISTRYPIIKAALQSQLSRLHGQQRLSIYSIAERQTNCRYWLNQKQV